MHVWAYRFDGEYQTGERADHDFRAFGFDNREMIGRCSQTLVSTDEAASVDFYVVRSLKGTAALLRRWYFPKRRVVLERRRLGSYQQIVNSAHRIEAMLLEALRRYDAQEEGQSHRLS